jgi:23S rRNA (adenine2503-C2)-methyltransferase
MIELIGRTTEEIQQLMVGESLPAYRGKQVADWLYRKPLPSQGGGAAADFSLMTDLPTSLRGALSSKFRISPLTVVETARDLRDGTVKLVVALHDGPKVEAVLMPDTKRVSVCISSQAGCPLACAFCATGTQGLARNLTTGEIVAQLLELQRLSERRITNIVFMGMGEPLLNYDAVVGAIRIFNREIGIAMRHITVSTVGILPVIDKLANEQLQITLAVSLHAPNDTLRTRLVPVHAKYDMTRLMETCRRYFKTTGRRVTFEYILLRGVNDNPKEAHELADLLRDAGGAVNLIPYNPTTVVEKFDRPEGERIVGFKRVLEAAGLTVTQRKERGKQIFAACGQLATQERYRTSPTARPIAMALNVLSSEPILTGVDL